MDKKAQGISLNVIIIAAIALLVLVILSVIFMGRMGTFGEKSKDCLLQGGSCVESCGSDFPTKYDVWTCAESTQVCCIKGG